jgi:hypothetical protein
MLFKADAYHPDERKAEQGATANDLRRHVPRLCTYNGMLKSYGSIYACTSRAGEGRG